MPAPMMLRRADGFFDDVDIVAIIGFFRHDRRILRRFTAWRYFQKRAR